jgi:hypothetical protein
MSKIIRANLTLTEETKQKGLELSKTILGSKNLSVYVSYLINKEHKLLNK